LQLPLFPHEAGLSIKFLRFPQTSLGQLRAVLPIKELAAQLPQRPANSSGAPPWLDNEGKIALQFLKANEDCSDEKLLERINTNWAIQFFLGICLKDTEKIKDKDLIWKTRKYVAQQMDIKMFQKILIDKWYPNMEDTKTGLTDATCYESYIKYPTDVKLIWDCIKWLHQQLKYWCKRLKIARPKNKYSDHEKKQKIYDRLKRKPYKIRRKRIRVLLLLCDKLLTQLDSIFILLLSRMETQENYDSLKGLQELEALKKDLPFLNDKNWGRYTTIGKIYNQQRYMYDNPGESVKNRIVSLYKPYLRPIVRGKENKRVEFGAKLNTWQVSGLNFIEHLSFDAFHEGIRFKNGVTFHLQHFKQLHRAGGDKIYATNDNRSFCKKMNISTNFRPKGRPKMDPILRKQDQQVRQEIGKARATVLEGSYGNDKNHYGLRKIKARNETTEVGWIFFGMMTANAVKMVNKIKKQKRDERHQIRPAPIIEKAA